MSTPTIQEMLDQQWDDINKALHEGDTERMYELADQLKKQGDDEQAEQLLAVAVRIDAEGMVYDEYNNR